ncbi:hypothetical protein BU204_27050 [Actinophytocola xanthii]|uniref:BetI-type transcriptional repressor C-terminal domain-containing protein n=1 Tax=Actinophytocola xanthii TaxID=1912961 RepID=A0A1Q8CGL6_9PSEU|nr:hypothetical protein BU204_27050 [Actinophytocola xanthii]
MPLGGIASHLRSGEVTRRAKLSAGSLYYHWMSQDEYIVDLVDYVLRCMSDERAAKAKEHAQDMFAATLEDDQPLPKAVRSIGNAAFAQLQADDSVFLQMALWSAHRDDPEIARRLKDMYSRVQSCWRAHVEQTVQAQGRKWRSPFDASAMTTALIALSEGLLLRSKVDPEAVPEYNHPDGNWTMMSTLSLALYHAMTTTADELDDVRDQD